MYVDHRLIVVRRRTEHQLATAEDRLHRVEGLLIAIADIDEVIAVIRSSDDVESARQRLMIVFDLSRTQAEYILELRLRPDKVLPDELESERGELEAEIERLRAILADEQLLRRSFPRPLTARLGAPCCWSPTPRGGVLLLFAPLEIPDDPCWVLLSGTSLLPAPRCRPPRAVSEAPTMHLEGPSHRPRELGIVTSGRLVPTSLTFRPSLRPRTHRAAGGFVTELVTLAAGERIVGLASLADSEAPITLGTREGVKQVTPITGPRGLVDHFAQEGDEVIDRCRR